MAGVLNHAALFAPFFSTLLVPVAACWHCIAPTTELRKTYSEFAPSRPRSFMQIQISGMPNRCGMTVGLPFQADVRLESLSYGWRGPLLTPSATFASRGAAEIHSLVASAPGIPT